MKAETQSAETSLAQLRRLCDDERASMPIVTIGELRALVACAEIVHTDYLLLSNSQRMKALHALKVLTDE
jgi:hypothetical protein